MSEQQPNEQIFDFKANFFSFNKKLSISLLHMFIEELQKIAENESHFTIISFGILSEGEFKPTIKNGDIDLAILNSTDQDFYFRLILSEASSFHHDTKNSFPQIKPNSQEIDAKKLQASQLILQTIVALPMLIANPTAWLTEGKVDRSKIKSNIKSKLSTIK